MEQGTMKAEAILIRSMFVMTVAAVVCGIVLISLH
jgi:hypothetical protein